MNICIIIGSNMANAYDLGCIVYMLTSLVG